MIMQVKLAEADSIDIKLALYKLQASVVVHHYE